jgi:putative DNA primase/helicase
MPKMMPPIPFARALKRLGPVATLAADYGAAIIGVSHLNKGGGAEAMMRVMGSLAFVAAARAAYAVVRDKDNDERRLFLPIKNNIGNDRLGYAFTIESVTLASDIETSRVAWDAEYVTTTADEAMAGPMDDDAQSALDEAKSFLERELSGAPVSVKELKANAAGCGISWRTVKRAKSALGVKPRKGAFKEGWTWELPSKTAKYSEDSHVYTVGEDGGLGGLGRVGQHD